MNPIIEQRTINLSNLTSGKLYHLNHPQRMPQDVEFTQHLIAPLGDVILLELYGVGFRKNGCPNGAGIEIYDNYADAESNGTIWNLCRVPTSSDQMDSSSSEEDEHFSKKHFNSNVMQPAPVHITSYLNTLHIKQRTNSLNVGAVLNATVRITSDANYKFKLVSSDNWVESCQPNPCQFGGKCISSGEKRMCQCRTHFTGRFCGLNMCELEPCIFGQCELTPASFKCHCQPGYVGQVCDQRQKPCAENPCESRGECFEKNGGYFCR